MNVFNSFPIIWEMTRGGPGYETSTTTVFMYDLKGAYVGQSAAMSIVNFGLVVGDRPGVPAAEPVEREEVSLRHDRRNSRTAAHRRPRGRERDDGRLPTLQEAIFAAAAYVVAVIFCCPTSRC